MVQMLGWFRAEAARASRRKRSSACESLAKVIRQELQGDKAPELRVFGFVDHSHATAAQFLGNPVVRDGLVDHENGKCRWPYVRALLNRSQRLLSRIRLPTPASSASRTPPRLRTSLWKAQAAQEVLKARVSAKGIQLGVGGDPGRAVRALVEGFSQP